MIMYVYYIVELILGKVMQQFSVTGENLSLINNKLRINYCKLILYNYSVFS